MAKQAKSDPAVKRCIDAFYAAYVRRHNPHYAETWLAEMAAGVPVAQRTTPQAKMILPMIKGAKDGALFAKMLSTWGEERVLRMIDDMFGACYALPFVINSNQDIGALFMVAPRLLIKDRVSSQPRRTSNNLDAAARAMGRRAPGQRLQLPEHKEER